MEPTTQQLQCRISYRGDFGLEADTLAQAMTQATGAYPAIKREEPDAELGIEHFVITILASAALKAAFSVALDELRKFLIDLVRRRREKANRPHDSGKAVIILDIKGLGLKNPRPQLEIEKLEEDAVDKFIKAIQEAVGKATASTAKA